MKYSRMVFVFLTLTAESTALAEAKFDFAVQFVTCKTTAGALVRTEKNPSGIITMDGDPYLLTCIRNHRKINCTTIYPDNEKGIKGNKLEFALRSEVNGLMIMDENHGADFMIIDISTTKTAVETSRVLMPGVSGSKVCRGSYLTYDEYTALQTANLKSNSH